MQSLVHLVVLLILLGILISLGSALYHLTRGPSDGDSSKMVRALAIRVGLSLALFFLLMLAWYAGLIQPHGLQPR